MAIRHLLFAGLATSASAAKLLVSGYGPTTEAIQDGYLETLDYTKDGLKKVADNTEAGPQPTWIDFTLKGKAVVLDEAWANPNVSGLHTFTLGKDGKVVHKTKVDIPRGGPVSTQFYNGNKQVAIAHYGGHGITTFNVGADGAFTLLENVGYEGRPVGPKPQQADGSHVHQAIVDPTGQYLIFPDLGLDRTHVFCINGNDGKLIAHADLEAPAGYGPRHAVFYKDGRDTYLAITHELRNVIINYKVTYVRSGGLTFEKVAEVSTYGAETEATQFGAAAEIAVSPDHKFLIASNRNVTLQQVPNVDPKNATQIDSDSIASFKINKGALEFVQLVPSGGRFPRHFELSKDGKEIAVANQLSGNVRIYARDVKTGKIGEQKAAIAVPGAPNMVRWL